MKHFFSIFYVLISNWRKAKSQLFFTFMGITIACSLWSSVDAINNQTIRAQEEALSLFTSARNPIIVEKNSSLIDESIYVKLRLDGWKVNKIKITSGIRQFCESLQGRICSFKFFKS